MNATKNKNEPITAETRVSITASLVPAGARLGTLPRVFGDEMIRAEALVYRWMSALCPEYGGGFWRFLRLSNGGFYMAPDCQDRLLVKVDGNGFSGSMSSNAAGITACLFAFSHIASLETMEQDRFIELFHALRDFASAHPEAAAIFKAID